MALEKYPRIESLSIDTWAVDYLLLKGNEPVLSCPTHDTASALPMEATALSNIKCQIKAAQAVQ